MIELTSDAPLPINPSKSACRLPTTFKLTLPKIIYAAINNTAVPIRTALTPPIIDFTLSVFIILCVILLIFYFAYCLYNNFVIYIMKITHVLLCTITTFAITSSLSALTLFSFSGGDGTPLTITVPQDIAFTATSPGVKNPVFRIKGTGVPGDDKNVSPNLSGTAAFTIEGDIRSISELATISNNYDPTSIFYPFMGDIYFFSYSAPPSNEDSVVLLAGTIITEENFAPEAPADGAYDIYLVDNFSQPISPAGVAIPEPSTFALLAGVAIFGAALLRHRRV